MKIDLQSKPGENLHLFVPARWTFSRIPAVWPAKQGARILANLEAFQRITGGMEQDFQTLEPNVLRSEDQPVSWQEAVAVHRRGHRMPSDYRNHPRCAAHVGQKKRTGRIGEETKAETESDKMKIDLQSKPGEPGRLAIPVSDFDFEAYSVRIKHGFPCFPDRVSSQTKPRRLWLSRMFRSLPRTVRESARSAGYQTGCVATLPGRNDITNNLRIIENDRLASAWTARAMAARMFIGFKHPESSWITDRLPVALWPKALRHEIQQAGFARPAIREVGAA